MDSNTEWRIYTSKTSVQLKSSRGVLEALRLHDRFRVRPSGSKKGVYRLYFEHLGPNTVFSIDEKIFKKCQANSVVSEIKRDSAVDKMVARLTKVKAGSFWEIVDTLDWPRGRKKHGVGYAKICRLALLEVFPLRKARSFGIALTKRARTLKRELEKYLDRNEDIYFDGGDDSFWDANCEAVSLGEKTYSALLKDPKKFFIRFNKPGSFEESFLYCFPP